MKKIMTLAIIALASVAMISCSGQPKQKQGACGEPCCQPKSECVECEKKAECPKAACAECEKKAECPKAAAVECPKRIEGKKKAVCGEKKIKSQKLEVVAQPAK